MCASGSCFLSSFLYTVTSCRNEYAIPNKANNLDRFSVFRAPEGSRLTGMIPSEVGMLRNLTVLDVCKYNNVRVLVVCAPLMCVQLTSRESR